jgi:putative ABC transport system ATP-binding protein
MHVEANTASASAPATDKTAGERAVIIRTLRLTKIYHMGDTTTHALRGIDAVIYRGESIAVMGPSGSGKTTFFNMVGGLDSPSSGRVFIDEVDVAQLSAVELAFLRCRKIGYIFQSYNLLKFMTALENVTVPMVFAGVREQEAQERGMALLGLVGLADRWHHKPIQMSGGQQQRVAIARSMSNNPSILLCDEPTANLDLKTGKEILDILRRLNRERQVTIICATHDHRMLDVCDRMMWIRDGQVERIRRRDEVSIEVGSINGEAE